MSVGRILTLGLGNPFAGVKYLPTLGLGTGAEPPPPATVNYQGDGKSHRRKRRNRTQELFDNIEATLFAKMRGDVELPSVLHIGADTATVSDIEKIDIREAVGQLSIAAKGYTDLTQRLEIIKAEVRSYEAARKLAQELDDEDAFMMMGY